MVIRDLTVPGLQLRVTPAGVKTFSVYFRPYGDRIGKTGGRLKGKQRRVTLGEFPTLSLNAAREQATDIMGQVLRGEDPWADRKNEAKHRYSNVFESAVERFIDELKTEISSWKNAESALRNHVLPRWATTPVPDITKNAATDLISSIAKSGKKGAARQVRKYLYQFFEWAIDQDIVKDNPLRIRKQGKRKSNVLAVNTEAGRDLTRAEIKAAWRAAEQLPYPFGPWYRILMLTGQRRADWANSLRSELKAESELEPDEIRKAEGAGERFVLDISAHRYKSDRNHLVPLVPKAVKILTAIPTWTGNDYALFSGSEGRKPISGFSKAKSVLDSAMLDHLRSGDPFAVLKPFRVHDFRVTCRTRLTYLGVSEEIAEAVLGHSAGTLGKIYNKHHYLEEKRDALTKYAGWLLEIVD
jgi:integrase